MVRIYSKNQVYTGLSYATRLYVGDYAASSSMEELCAGSRGIARLAVCRVDVDNLGQAFVSGFRSRVETTPEKRIPCSPPYATPPCSWMENPG